MDGEKMNHDSFGMLSFNRVSGGNSDLFGCSVKHNNRVRMRVSTASLMRDLSCNWYFPKECLVEVEMSYNQFAEAISSMNHGSGVPVTLMYAGNERKEKCPSVSMQDKFRKEFQMEVDKAMDTSYDLVNKLSKIVEKGRLTKAEKEEIVGLCNAFKNEVSGTLPFLNNQFIEAMDDVVLEAKSEFDGFVMDKINNLGIEALKEKYNSSLAISKDGDKIDG